MCTEAITVCIRMQFYQIRKVKAITPFKVIDFGTN